MKWFEGNIHRFRNFPQLSIWEPMRQLGTNRVFNDQALLALVDERLKETDTLFLDVEEANLLSAARVYKDSRFLQVGDRQDWIENWQIDRLAFLRANRDIRLGIYISTNEIHRETPERWERQARLLGPKGQPGILAYADFILYGGYYVRPAYLDNWIGEVITKRAGQLLPHYWNVPVYFGMSPLYWPKFTQEDMTPDVLEAQIDAARQIGFDGITWLQFKRQHTFNMSDSFVQVTVKSQREARSS